jgi:hypothetical protein
MCVFLLGACELMIKICCFEGISAIIILKTLEAATQNSLAPGDQTLEICAHPTVADVRPYVLLFVRSKDV